MEDKSRSNVVQIKGRFSVTSENVELAKVILFSMKCELIKRSISDALTNAIAFQDVPVVIIPRRSSQV